jgi:hypothetical protein
MGRPTFGLQRPVPLTGNLPNLAYGTKGQFPPQAEIVKNSERFSAYFRRISATANEGPPRNDKQDVSEWSRNNEVQEDDAIEYRRAA